MANLPRIKGEKRGGGRESNSICLCMFDACVYISVTAASSF